MGDLDFIVRIKTEDLDPASLMETFGRSAAQGRFRVPAKLAAGRPFVLIFLTRSGEEAIKGTAEVVGHDENETWVRFLSASAPRRDAEIVLTNVKVTVVPSTAGTPPVMPPRDPRRGAPLRSLPAISLPPANAGPSSQPERAAPLLGSVVPWWTQPPEQATPQLSPHGSAASHMPHRSAEAAVDFAEASGTDLARPLPDEPRGAYPRPPTPTPTPMETQTAPAQTTPAQTAPTQTTPAPEPLARRVLWGAIAIAITCAVVAIAAIWWALEMRASARAARSAPAVSETSAPEDGIKRTSR
jgi:hypothetical protein